MTERFVCYYRVSTGEQEESGLGLSAQRKTVEDYLSKFDHEILNEYTEVESGGNNNRPEIKKAIMMCRLKKSRLIVSKLDRLSRDIYFITTLQQSGVSFVIAEMPDATELTIHIYAAMAQHERKLISQRTKQALAVLKANGARLGNPCIYRGERIPGSCDLTAANAARTANSIAYSADMATVIEDIIFLGSTTIRDITRQLNEAGYTAIRGGKFYPASVARIMEKHNIIITE